MDVVKSSTNSANQTTEIYIKKVLAGNIETVRPQLVDAIESLGYDIIEDEPNIIARRAARGWGKWYGSADVLDYASNLTVRLKTAGANSTRAVFDYSIKHPMLNKGENNIVVQEANTIAVISKKQAIEKMCPVCETDSTDDSRFCRNCGAPLTLEQAEPELLRMMAETRAGKTSVVGASILTLISSALLFITFILQRSELLRPKLFLMLLCFSGAGLLLAIISSFFGWNRLKRALEKPIDQVQTVTRHFPESLKTGEFDELPPRKVPASITEGTTNLLNDEWINRQEKEKVPVSNRRNTNNFD